MVCREVRETGRGTSRTGPSGRLFRHLACRPPQSRRFVLDTGMRPVPNASSGEPGEVPDDEVNAHLGNPGQGKDSCENHSSHRNGLRGVRGRPVCHGRCNFRYDNDLNLGIRSYSDDCDTPQPDETILPVAGSHLGNPGHILPARSAGGGSRELIIGDIHNEDPRYRWYGNRGF
jgi:hypothetical protein